MGSTTRKIVFYTETQNKAVLSCHVSTKRAILQKRDNVHTTMLHLLSFDLFEQGFSTIQVIHHQKTYDIKLSHNSWTTKELRTSHNLYKLLMSNIINKT